MTNKYVPTQKGVGVLVILLIMVLVIKSILINIILVLLFYSAMFKFGWFFFKLNPKKSVFEEILQNEDYKVKGQWRK